PEPRRLDRHDPEQRLPRPRAEQRAARVEARREPRRVFLDLRRGPAVDALGALDALEPCAARAVVRDDELVAIDLPDAIELVAGERAIGDHRPERTPSSQGPRKPRLPRSRPSLTLPLMSALRRRLLSWLLASLCVLVGAEGAALTGFDVGDERAPV